ncbi:leucyl aminopeptidase family protein [Adhaeribacter sp. BT258]|uniref:Leucyl aminopeptidase family protein n=1 Tax=Adhaeribacter terrigena TaxID=2793070 RepID=A0ABS1C1R2_9BACT|nr:leucyl aminopeptidase family protein [Adhaeribacter terrigena]MBK0402573.1 leucyl aminopeptidase family protein [Adhaeribacter terrigena]
MPTQLKYTASVPDNTDIVYIIQPTELGSVPKLSDAEKNFAQSQLDSKGKMIFINRYTYKIYIVAVPEKKTMAGYQEELRMAGHGLLKVLKADKVKNIAISDLTASNAARFVAVGIFLTNYEFLKYKSEAKPSALESIIITGEEYSETEITGLNHVLNSVFLARNLVNEPHNFQSAENLAEEFVKIGEEAGFQTEVLEMTQIQSLKMGGLLSVNQGSIDPPTFTIMEWKPENAQNEKPIMLVGKGVVYDTGGLSLKPTPNSMDLMKSDMAGAAAVVGIMNAVAKTNLPLHIVALVPATDNRPGGRAYAPGDVITMHNGKTVEVLNTDAEGRLILADALSFAAKYDPELVIDMATLTGAAVRAIGKEAIAMMGTASEEVKTQLKIAGEHTYERLIEFPLWDEYGKHIESDIADIKNIGMAEAGHISAGKFLEHFTTYPWIHLDIAGTAFLTAPDSYRGKHATGSAVRLIYDFLAAKVKSKKA